VRPPIGGMCLIPTQMVLLQLCQLGLLILSERVLGHWLLRVSVQDEQAHQLFLGIVLVEVEGTVRRVVYLVRISELS